MTRERNNGEMQTLNFHKLPWMGLLDFARPTQHQVTLVTLILFVLIFLQGRFCEREQRTVFLQVLLSQSL